MLPLNKTIFLTLNTTWSSSACWSMKGSALRISFSGVAALGESEARQERYAKIASYFDVATPGQSNEGGTASKQTHLA